MGDVVTFRQDRGLERTWVPRAEEDWWIQWWGRHGVPAARWRDYRRWGSRFYPPPAEDVIRERITLRPKRRTLNNYSVWRAP